MSFFWDNFNSCSVGYRDALKMTERAPSSVSLLFSKSEKAEKGMSLKLLSSLPRGPTFIYDKFM